MFTKEKDYCSFIIIFLDEEGNSGKELESFTNII